jgi:hypothetical protein
VQAHPLLPVLGLASPGAPGLQRVGSGRMAVSIYAYAGHHEGEDAAGGAPSMVGQPAEAAGVAEATAIDVPHLPGSAHALGPRQH